MRSRPLVTVLLLLLVSAAAATAVLGPLLARSVGQATLQYVVDGAGLESVIAVTATVGDVESAETLSRSYSEQRGRLGDLLRGAVLQAESTAWREPEVVVSSTSNVTWGVKSAGATTSRVDAVVTGCAGLAVTQGRCPDGRGQVLVPASDAQAAGIEVGTTLRYLAGTPGRFQVVGLYDADRSDQGRLLRRSSAEGALAGVTSDPLVVTDDQAAQMLLPVEVSGRLVPAASLTVDDEPGLRRTVLAVRDLVGEQRDILRIDTQLPFLLDRADAQTASAGVLIEVVAAQALLLALLAVAVVLQRLARSRAPEWGIGRLRGLSRGRWLVSVYAEPALVLVLGTLVGYAAGTGVARAAVRTHLPAGTGVEPWRWTVWTATLLSLVVALASLVVVSLRTVRQPLSEVLQEASEPFGITPAGAVAQTVVVLLAATTLYELLAGGLLGSNGSRLGLLAPALFALAVAVIAVRAGVLLVRLLTGRPPRTLVALVVGRSAARRPSSLNPAVVLAGGVALAVFATQVLLVSTHNQDRRAAADVGADQVLQVDVPAGTDLRAAVNRADPQGRWAMAAEERVGSGVGGTGRIVAVDSSRFLAVTGLPAVWVGGADAVHALHPTGSEPLLLTGTRLTVTLSRVSLTTGGIGADGDFVENDRTTPPRLQLVLDDGKAWSRVGLGDLTPTKGAERRTITTSISCPRACRVVELGLSSDVGSGYRAGFTLTALSTDATSPGSTAPWLHEKGRWAERIGTYLNPEANRRAFSSSGADGLAVRFEDDNGGQPTVIGPTDVTDPAPVVAAPGLQAVAAPGSADVVDGTGLDGQGRLVHVVARAQILPRALADGVLVDLDEARGLSDPAESETIEEVWLAVGAPPEVETALRGAGVQVLARQRLSDERRDLRQEAPTRAATLALWIASGAVLVSLLCLITARVADVESRRRDWRSLRLAGLPTSQLRRLVLAEVLTPALLAVIVGAVSGGVAAVLAAPRLPVVDLSRAGPPLDLRISPTATLLVAAGTAAVVLVVAAGSALAEIRGRR